MRTDKGEGFKVREAASRLGKGFSSTVATKERIYVTGTRDTIEYLTALDRMSCFNATNGDEIWSVDLHQEYGSLWDMFGVSESVLLVDDKVITTPCGESTTVIALDKMTGALVWKSESIGAHRSNMLLVRHGDVLVGYNLKVSG